jgi:hypothetical protein
MGTAQQPTCVSNTCGTATSASRYDGACNYSSLTPTHYHPCPNNFAYYCNGAPLQDAAASCPTDCSYLNLLCAPGCGQYSCLPKNEKCLPGHSCTITQDNHAATPPSCKGACL